ncbi:Mgat1 [Symbiodinium necroappetens]|uniref:alpha-1,3-mannosyl-glycoprotein 2-beta-N-acetylglucosaminyltransferase n=1 Tax=Symbiodinium necroappetens TaxID=1628268 RepID=A0A813C7T2_9DINO|nr:Mgat1 [Symbiodinium necroappetens]
MARKGKREKSIWAGAFQPFLLLAGGVILTFVTVLIVLYTSLGRELESEFGQFHLSQHFRGLRRVQSAVLGRVATDATSQPSSPAAMSQRPAVIGTGFSTTFAGASAMHAAPEMWPALEGGRAGVVILAHDRPDCLARCLDSLVAQPDLALVASVVSLDHPASFRKMEAVVEKYSAKFKIGVWHKPDDASLKVAVAKIAAHFKFAISQSFEVAGFEFAIFVENDLTLAPDFLWYFRLTAPLLLRDPSVWCVSAWNDNGFRELAPDEHRLFRTDYFPGLGWMIRNSTWPMLRDSWPAFPSTGWDHWMRHGSGLKPRDCIAPEAPRTRHVDSKGTNVKAGTPILKLLEKMATSSLPHGQLHDVTYLLREEYETKIRKLLQDGELVRSLDELQAHIPDKVPGRYHLIPYVREDFPGLAKKLQLYPGQPRGGWRGIIFSRHPQSHALLALIDRRQGEGLLPENELWRADPGNVITKAQPGQSCEMACSKAGLRCDPRQLEFANNCNALKQHFPCENGCGHQVGAEIPCYVHDMKRDTALQCLVTDESAPSCASMHPATTRLCMCTPAQNGGGQLA